MPSWRSRIRDERPVAGETPVGGLDWTPFAGQIVEDAEAALGFPFIVLSRFDAAARTSQAVWISGMQGRNNQRALRLGQRLVPRFDVYRASPIDANPLLRATFEGQGPVTGSVEDFTRGVVPPLIARIASQIAGFAHCLAIPLCVGTQVLGSLSFHQRSLHFSPQWVRIAPAFSRQVALSIHNAELLEEGRRLNPPFYSPNFPELRKRWGIFRRCTGVSLIFTSPP